MIVEPIMDWAAYTDSISDELGVTVTEEMLETEWSTLDHYDEPPKKRSRHSLDEDDEDEEMEMVFHLESLLIEPESWVDYANDLNAELKNAKLKTTYSPGDLQEMYLECM